MSVLAFRPSPDDALHHRRSAFAYRCNRVRPIPCFHDCSWSVRRAPCRVQFLCARDPIARESDVFLVGLHHLAMMPRRLVAIPSTPSMFPSSATSVSPSLTRFRSRERTVDPHSSCGVLSDTIGCVHREVVARTWQARFARESYYSFPCGLECRTQARLYSSGWVPVEQPVDEPDGHPSSLRQSWPIGGVSSLSGAEVLAGAGRFDEIAFHRSSP